RVNRGSDGIRLSVTLRGIRFSRGAGDGRGRSGTDFECLRASGSSGRRGPAGGPAERGRNPRRSGEAARLFFSVQATCQAGAGAGRTLPRGRLRSPESRLLRADRRLGGVKSPCGKIRTWLRTELRCSGGAANTRSSSAISC